MKSESSLKKKFSLIPNDLDILITHGPEKGCLDKNLYGELCGSTSLREEIAKKNPKIHLCGHIHEQGGFSKKIGNTLHFNCSYVNENNKPANMPVRITL
jgi:Icc-related predicted phosphoesterase